MNRLPKCWLVENDRSQEFKDTVLSYLNSKYDKMFSGNWNYYGYNGIHPVCRNTEYCVNNPTLLTLDEFIELSKPIDDFVLPEKWRIQSTEENYSVIYEWLGKNKTTIYLYINLGNADKNSPVCFPEYRGYHQCKGDSTYKEITFGQFQKYVLKLKDMEKKIVGYKLKDNCLQYFDAVSNIAKDCSSNIQMSLEGYPTVIKRLEEAGVLNLWFEPVYEEEYPDIIINGHKGEFFNDYVKFGCAEIGKELFIQINKLILARFDCGISNKEIESITIGKGTFTKDQIKQIAEYYIDKH